MTYSVKRISALEWAELSAKVHLVTFGDNRSGLDRVDFALLGLADGELGGFMTIKEMDSETAYIQHGGVFPNFAKSLSVAHGFRTVITAIKGNYQRIWMKVENTNIPMIKLALSQGFIVNGTSLVKNKLYLELLMEV